MMLKPIRAKTSDRNRVSQTKSLPAPTKGWYVGENLAEAPEGTAFILNNAFPQLDYVRVRRGSQAWATGIGASVSIHSLLSYSYAGLSKLFAVGDGKIYDVSSTGAVGAAKVSGLGSSHLEYVQFTGLGGSYIVAVNGVDGVQTFDGTNWNKTYSFTGDTTNGSVTIANVSSTSGLLPGQYISGAGVPTGATIATVGVSSITISVAATATAAGVALTAYMAQPITTTTGAIFSNVSIFKSRLYFVESASLNVWYLGVNAIGGAATVFPMQGVFRLGGEIVATATWSIDSTSGIYEAFIAITSEGEVAMYDGSDPSVWSLKGIYRISKPLGKRCAMKAGGDLAIMTEDGIVPMSKVQQLDQIALSNVAITKPIAPAWRQAVVDRSGKDGWEMTMWPLESMGIVNLPKKNSGDRTQFIVNARTGAWANYEGWDANCFAIYNNSLYYGSSDGRVMQAEVGAADDGVNYTWTVFPSFSTLDGSSSRKQVIMVRPYITANMVFTPGVSINVDFDTRVPSLPGAVNPGSPGAKWDIAVWDTDLWPAELIAQNNWITSAGYGAVASPIIQVTLSTSTTTPDIRLTRIDVLFEGGNMIG